MIIMSHAKGMFVYTYTKVIILSARVIMLCTSLWALLLADSQIVS